MEQFICPNRYLPAGHPERHVHAQLIGGKAKQCEHYTDKMYTAILRGMRLQLEKDGFIGALECGFNLDKEEVDFQADTWEEFYDDISGALLDSGMVSKARDEELEFVRDFGVYTKVPAWESVGHPLISTRWIDINKGDVRNPFYRSRLVCREFKSSDPFLEGTFAATPPAEALKYLLSLEMTRKPGGKFKKLLILDVSRAHFHAVSKRKVFIKLPPVDEEEGMVGRLDKTMYRTRDAANLFGEFSILEFRALDFEAGLYSPCLLHRKKDDVIVFQHGDDIAALGDEDELNELEKGLGRNMLLKRFAWDRGEGR